MGLKERLFKTKGKNKVAVIGLDGVPYDLIEDLVNAGKMPALAEILKEGSPEKMKSSIPPVSSVAWTTFMTGVNPGKHGIYGFIDLKDYSYDPYFPNFTDIKSPLLWDSIAAHGKKTIAINIPQTYPAKEINGILISGFVALDLQKAVYPPSFYPKLKKMDYRIDVDYQEAAEKKEEFFTDLFYTLKKRGEAIKYFLMKEQWDLFIGVFTGTDRLHHYFWNEYENPQERYHQKFIDYYTQLDTIIGDLVDSLPGHCHLMIMADHGFCALKQEFFPNTWLKEKGYLKLKKDPPDSFSDIHSDSKAFILDPGRVYINLKGRMPEGCVKVGREYDDLREELMQGFMGISSPSEPSSPILERIFRKEELFSGPYLNKAPDLVLHGLSGYDIKGSMSKGYLFGKGRFTGMHTYSDAFLFLRGGDLKGNYDIVDLAPSILYLLGIPLPNHFDSKPLSSLSLLR